MLRVFITGANGFVGRETCAAFTRGGHHVIAGVRAARKAQGLMCADVFESRQLSRDPDLRRVLKGADTIVHCAGWNGSKTASSPAAALIAENTAEARLLCERAASSAIPHFILLSSIKAVAAITSGKPLAEDTLPHPTDVYGRSKLAIEDAIFSVPGIAKSVIRPPAIYGPGMTGGLATLFRLAARGVPLPLKGIANRRDILALPSLAEFLVRCAEVGGVGEAGFRILHARDGLAMSTAALYQAMGRALHKNVHTFNVPEALLRTALFVPGAGSKVESLLHSLEVDDTRSRQLLRWTPSQRMESVFESISERMTQN